MPNNPIYPRRLDAMRREHGGYASDIVGSPAVVDNSKLAFPELDESALVVADGGHRYELARVEDALDDEFIAILYRGKTRAEVHRLRRGLNDRRSVKPAEVFLERCAEGDITLNAIKAAVEGAGFHVSYEREPAGLPCTNELEWIWRQDHNALVRALDTYVGLWGHESFKAQARVVKGIGAFWVTYPEADANRLLRTVKAAKLEGAKITPDSLYRAAQVQAATVPALRRRAYAGVRYLMAGTYNHNRPRGALPLLP